MEKWEQLNQSADSCFQTLQTLIDQSFQLMDDDEDQREEVIALWRKHILKFVNHTYKMSEKYNNRDVIKAITKALMFGK